MKRQMKLICTVCPQGCEVAVERDGDRDWHVEGNRCRRGREFALQEMINPTRVLTTSVWVDDGDHRLVSVKTDRAIPKDAIKSAIEEITKITVNAPIKLGDTIVENIAGTDANIVATRDICVSSTISQV